MRAWSGTSHDATNEMEHRMTWTEVLRARGVTSKILSPEEGARETREKLDHTLRAYARLEQRSAEKGREIARLRKVLEGIRDQEWVENCLDPQWAARIATEALRNDV